ncbi:MAG: bifunctional folylpolyglutamate synthase/dihydrofolate synthase [Candidatus Thermoplasmatota archaeon]|nr:bifunctional folylpolyglutamate synthase/dihydrofolate synthase [Candidatus Thermoplasmatota archaeon]
MKEDVLEFIYRLKREGIKYDLATMRSYDALFGKPHESYKNIHITGSNGKGSVSSMIFNVMRMRKRTGLYTSPHLIEFNERILAQDQFISDMEIESLYKFYMPFVEAGLKNDRNPTFFEITTEMAFQHFKNTSMDWASIEVGLGGRLDATNVITPEISVVTRIGYEHTDKLGTTLMEIAREKGGIIKDGKPLVTGEKKPEPYKELERICKMRNSRIIRAWEYVTVKDLRINGFETSFKAITPNDEYDITLNVPGKFQVENACTAISTLENSGEFLDRKNIEEGMNNTRWPGRLQVVSKNPLVVVDSSHNPPAATTLASSVRDIYSSKPVLIVGMLSDKDHYSYLHNISKCADSIILTTPEEPQRAQSPEKLRMIAEGVFKNVKVIEDPMEAYEYSISRNDFTLVTGSMYLVGKILKELNIDMRPFSK